jgi:hypothetical protein
MDLYGSSDAAIQMGNARRQQVRDMNDRIAQHNKDVSDKIAGLKDQEATTSTVKDIEATGKALWTGSGMPGKVKAYQDYRAANLRVSDRNYLESKKYQHPQPLRKKVDFPELPRVPRKKRRQMLETLLRIKWGEQREQH